ncbi:alcohol dehydrogenase catalytic domain-containing protein [Actinacidiphila oryziradicis]|uniref:Alcohol dehydrogenase-like N-terminal domain-containing protein n=1 Tax=Actinacidiphila oryziradicis TaxID=2571141 RepID=A0A4U0SHS5_9ACTN|nr:hypothetical protein FCI23_23075 [Actinacidiphila oryziradicis]
MDTATRRLGLAAGQVPFVPRVEGAGRVSALGEGVTELAVGDRVAWAYAATVPFAPAGCIAGRPTSSPAHPCGSGPDTRPRPHDQPIAQKPVENGHRSGRLSRRRGVLRRPSAVVG